MQINKERSNGAQSQAPVQKNSSGASGTVDIENATKTPSQLVMQRKAEFGQDAAAAGEATLEFLAPIDTEHPCLSIILLGLGGKATREGVQYAGGALFRRIEREVVEEANVVKKIAKGGLRGE